ncbi:MAG: arylformamidase [Parvularculaceae bacterium]|nr:arylformamidase [Parvularculaceae bacterium]
MAVIDITPPLSAATPMWPGDTPFSARRTWAIEENGAVNVSMLTMSSHAGAHADAPLHYSASGASIDAVPLDPYLGRCLVVRIDDAAPLIGPERLMEAIGRFGPAPPPRVLIRTYSKAPTLEWDSSFTAIAADAVRRLAKRGVKLIGVDTPSLDPEQSKTMDAHQAILAADMRVLEGLVLDAVDEGEYELIALPLKLKGLDAAPVRAVLRTLR